MKSFIYIMIQISLIFVLWAGGFGAFGQNEIQTSQDFLSGYELIYGNQNMKIINFEIHQNGLSLLSRVPNEVSEIRILLLNDEYLLSDSLVVSGWHSSDLWKIGGDIYYRPSVLYKNSFCDRDGRKTKDEIVVKLSTAKNKITQVECLNAGTSKRGHVYEYDDLSIEKSKRFSGVYHLKIYNGGKLKLRKEAKRLHDSKNEPFIIERTNGGFIILNTVSREIYLVEKDEEIEVFEFEHDFNLSEFKLQIKYDNIRNLIHLLQIPTNKKSHYMSLYSYDFEKFNKHDARLRKSFYSKVNGGKIFSAIDVERSDGNFNGIFSLKIPGL